MEIESLMWRFGEKMRDNFTIIDFMIDIICLVQGCGISSDYGFTEGRPDMLYTKVISMALCETACLIAITLEILQSRTLRASLTCIYNGWVSICRGPVRCSWDSFNSLWPSDGSGNGLLLDGTWDNVDLFVFEDCTIKITTTSSGGQFMC